MKPHKHAELIKAWADGAEIEVHDLVVNNWHEDLYPTWNEHRVYRIKPQPKHDVVADIYLQYNADSGVEMYKAQTIKNIRLRFNYYTGELKSAEVLK